MGQSKYIPTTTGVVKTVVNKTVVQPSKDLAQGIFRGKPRYIRLNESGATTADITPFVRAGMQTRYLAAEGSKLAFFKTPKVFYGTAKYLVRSAVRDNVISPFYSGFYRVFETTKIFSRSRGYIPAWEKAGDKIFLTTNRYLNQVGLAPTLRGDIGSAVRIAVIGNLYLQSPIFGGSADVIYTTSRKYIKQAEDYVSRAQAGSRSADSGGVLLVPAPSPGVEAPRVVLPVTLPPTAPNAPPPPNRRRYIPAGD
jgi:hypothetical protein